MVVVSVERRGKGTGISDLFTELNGRIPLAVVLVAVGTLGIKELPIFIDANLYFCFSSSVFSVFS